MLLNLLYGHSLFLTAILVVGSSVVFALAGQWLVHIRIPLAQRRGHNDVIGFSAATASLIYVVLLAFIASTVWISYDRADKLVNQEASLAIDLFHDGSMLPKAFGDQTLALLRDYAKNVVEEEWPNMARGERAGREGWQYLRKFYSALGEASVEKPVHVAIIQEMITRLNTLYDVRRERLRTAARPSLDAVIWFVVLAGGMITIAFCWLFGFEKGKLHKLSTAMVAATLGLVIFLIVVFNYPFRGRMQIDIAPFAQALRFMDKRLSGSGQPTNPPVQAPH